MKAIITKKSEMVVNGSITILYDIYNDAGDTLYTNLEITDNPSSIADDIRMKMGEIKQQKKEANKINVGDVIDL